MKPIVELYLALLAAFTFTIGLSYLAEKYNIDTLPEVSEWQDKKTIEKIEKEFAVTVNWEYIFSTGSEHFYNIHYQNNTQKNNICKIKGVIIFEHAEKEWVSANAICNTFWYAGETYSYPKHYGHIKEILVLSYDEM